MVPAILQVKIFGWTGELQNQFEFSIFLLDNSKTLIFAIKTLYIPSFIEYIFLSVIRYELILKGIRYDT